MIGQRIDVRVKDSSISKIRKILDNYVLNELEINHKDSWCLQKIKAAELIPDFELFVNHLNVGGEVDGLADTIEVAENQRRRITWNAAFAPVIQLITQEEVSCGYETDKQ